MNGKSEELLRLEAIMDASRVQQEQAYASTAIVNLEFSATYAARFALGCGADAETIALVLESIAGAIRNPGDVAENMSPIRWDEF